MKIKKEIMENKTSIVGQLYEVVQHPLPGNVPAFLVKLWNIVENETLDDIVSWSQV